MTGVQTCALPIWDRTDGGFIVVVDGALLPIARHPVVDFETIDPNRFTLATYRQVSALDVLPKRSDRIPRVGRGFLHSQVSLLDLRPVQPGYHDVRYLGRQLIYKLLFKHAPFRLSARQTFSGNGHAVIVIHAVSSDSEVTSLHTSSVVSSSNRYPFHVRQIEHSRRSLRKSQIGLR